MKIRAIPSQPAFFAHQGKAAVERGEGFGCQCAICQRDIAAPHSFQGRVIWCIYCGMERGRVCPVETPWGYRWSFGISAGECAEDRAALEAGRFDEMAEARARRYGKLVEF